MTITKSQTEKIGSILKGNNFVIPLYQRKYSWTDVERKALWDDVEESIANNMNHFLGTLTFEEKAAKGLSTDTTYDVIDGQQRLTSMYILLHSLIERLDDKNTREDLMREFIGASKTKLKLLGDDESFFVKVIRDFKRIKNDKLTSRSQKQLYQAKRQFNSLITPLSNDDVKVRILFIRDKIDVLVFNVESQAQAVKMFSIINDRGLPLSILDKTKSALMLYSYLKLNGKLNDTINSSFKDIFDAYDEIIEYRDKLNILSRFDEITLFTSYYYSARKYFSNIWNNRDGADTIFNNIKIKCDDYKNDTIELENFILGLTNDFRDFCQGYSDLIKAINKKKRYEKTFRFLEFTVTLYPLIVRLFMQGKLDKLLPVLEAIEVRVYKVKGTNPIADIYWLSSYVVENDLTVDEIKKHLINFNEKFMNDYNIKSYLNQDIYGNNAVKYILMEYNRDYMDIKTYKDLQVEHIFSREPNFAVSQYGFSDDYNYERNRLGNLTLLEQKINKQIQNVPPIHKVNGYLTSTIKDTRNIGGEIASGNFSKQNVDQRRDTIIDFCVKRFRL